MLFYAGFTTHPHTAVEQARARHDAQFRADALRPETWRGFYEFAGGGGGFLLIEAEEAHALTAVLQPYQDLVQWDVRALHAIDVDAFIDQVRQRNG